MAAAEWTRNYLYRWIGISSLVIQEPWTGKARTANSHEWLALERKRPHFSFILAASIQRGVIHHMIHNGGTNIERFSLFMEETLVAAGDNIQLTYLLDNASCHRREAETMNPGHHVVHACRHSPFFNICENAFSAWKSQLKRELAEVRPLLVKQPHEEQLATLGQLSEQALATVMVGKCIEWLQGIRHLISRCLWQEDFLQNHA